MALQPVKLPSLEKLSSRKVARLLRRLEVASVQAHNARVLRRVRAKRSPTSRPASVFARNMLLCLLAS